jgi:hypothetical protein
MYTFFHSILRDQNQENKPSLNLYIDETLLKKEGLLDEIGI